MKNFNELLNEFYDEKLNDGLFTTTNEKGENMLLEIMPQYLKSSTFQQNGWTRINIYYKDYTMEELYEK